MSLTSQQQQLIDCVNQRVKVLVKHGVYEDALLADMLGFFRDIEAIIHTSKEKEINMYCQAYGGFGYYMSLLAQEGSERTRCLNHRLHYHVGMRASPLAG